MSIYKPIPPLVNSDGNTPEVFIIAEIGINHNGDLKIAKQLIDQVSGYSPISNLSTGRSITWLELMRAFVVINVLVGGAISIVGIVVLTRRELAAPTKF